MFPQETITMSLDDFNTIKEALEVFHTGMGMEVDSINESLILLENAWESVQNYL